ncbi:MAG: hypothetical protein J5594_04440 [Elusimicrobiaceae bacterium]|nr:hypothetical protein [Elusimicrobiaceae bacterium]
MEKQNIFQDKTIILGLTGALTCFKICPLILRLKKDGVRFRIVASENALNFITKTTLQTLAKTEVLTTQFNPKKFDEKHKSLAEEGDIFLLSPATAHTISQVANGVANNLLTSVLCAWQKPLIIAPAMNQGMWFNPSTQANISALKKRGAIVIDAPKGALPDIDLIYTELEKVLKFQGKLKGKNILITSGNIKEQCGEIYLTAGESSDYGKTIADFAYIFGAKVILISDKSFDAPYQQILVKNSKDFEKVVSENLGSANIFLHTAKLLPYTVKSDKDFAFTLQKSEDIFKTFLQNKKPNQIFKSLNEEDFKDKTPQELATQIFNI